MSFPQATSLIQNSWIILRYTSLEQKHFGVSQSCWRVGLSPECMRLRPLIWGSWVICETNPFHNDAIILWTNTNHILVLIDQSVGLTKYLFFLQCTHIHTQLNIASMELSTFLQVFKIKTRTCCYSRIKAISYFSSCLSCNVPKQHFPSVWYKGNLMAIEDSAASLEPIAGAQPSPNIHEVETLVIPWLKR